VIDATIPKVQHPSTPEPAYVLRGLGLFELHADEILDSYQGGGRWLVPSGTDAGNVYEVRTGTRPERNRCECKGYQSHKHCSHLIAAERVAKRSAVCDGCGARTWRRDLSEVQESLTYFAGDLLCRSCRRGSDADAL
jgi:hypothetical protein